MNNRKLVINLVSKLPPDTPLRDIARQIELIAGIQVAREQAARGEGAAADAVRRSIDGWASR